MNKINKFQISWLWLKRQSLFCFSVLALLFGCSGNAAQADFAGATGTLIANNTAVNQPTTSSSDGLVQGARPATVVSVQNNRENAKAAEKLVARSAAMHKLALANDWHSEQRYRAAFDAYEAVLSERTDNVTDAYALAGIIALRLDRDNPDYNRESAVTVNFVLEQRLDSAVEGDRNAEARLLRYAVKLMLDADISKDNVVAENRRLASELAERDQALQRLREVTVGR